MKSADRGAGGRRGGGGGRYLIEGYLRPHHTPQGVDNGRVGDGGGRIAAVVDLRPGALEVEDRRPLGAVDRHRQGDGGPIVHVIHCGDNPALWQPLCLREAAQHVPHCLLRILLHVQGLVIIAYGTFEYAVLNPGLIEAGINTSCSVVNWLSVMLLGCLTGLAMWVKCPGIEQFITGRGRGLVLVVI